MKEGKRDRDGKLTEEEQILDEYLGQYGRCRNRKHALEMRMKDIEREFESPLKAVRMDGMPRGSSQNVGSAALSYELDEVHTRIAEEIEEIKKEYAKIKGVIDFLPKLSSERIILEYKYIDGYKWDKISDAEHRSRSVCIRLWRNGLSELLKYEKIKQLVREQAE